MPEELMIRCESCGLVFNKITYPECPRCRHLRRKPESFPGGTRGDFYAGDARGAAVTAVLSSMLPYILAFLAGGASFLIGVNLSAGLKWNEAPVVVLKVPQPYVVWKIPKSADGAAPAATVAPPSDAAEGSDADVLQLDQLSKTVSEANRVAFEGTIRNASSVSVEAARINVSGYDAANTELQTDWTLLSPPRLEPGDTAKFRLQIVNHPAIERFVFKSQWTQPVEKELRVLSALPAPQPQP